jgi:hypothetical protein
VTHVELLDDACLSVRDVVVNDRDLRDEGVLPHATALRDERRHVAHEAVGRGRRVAVVLEVGEAQRFTRDVGKCGRSWCRRCVRGRGAATARAPTTPASALASRGRATGRLGRRRGTTHPTTLSRRRLGGCRCRAARCALSGRTATPACLTTAAASLGRPTGAGAAPARRVEGDVSDAEHRKAFFVERDHRVQVLTRLCHTHGRAHERRHGDRPEGQLRTHFKLPR